MNKIRATQFQKATAVVTALVMTLTGTAVSAQSLNSTLAERRDAVMRKLQPPSESALAAAKTSNANIPGLDLLDRRQAGHASDVAAEQVFGKNFDHRDPASVAGRNRFREGMERGFRARHTLSKITRSTRGSMNMAIRER